MSCLRLASVCWPASRDEGAEAPARGAAQLSAPSTAASGGRAARTDLAANLVDFVRLLRDNDFPVSPAEVQDALRVMSVIDLGDRRELYLSLRAVLLWDPERRAQFDELFERFWGAWAEEQLSLVREQRQLLSSSAGSQERQEQSAGPSYSPIEVLVEKDFSDFRPDELGAVARACVAIAHRVATRRSRRVKPTHRGGRIDPRRTIRRNLKYGGTVIELARLEHKIRKPKITLICDVSRSMEQYSVFLLQFVHSMQNVIGRVESFVFSTSIHRVTPYFKHARIMQAIETISEEVPDWSGGTRIGESLRVFNEQYGRRIVDRRTVVIILSDGLDTGQTELLAEQMAEVHFRCARLIWLNPLLGRESYQPLARGMAAALPHVDVFAAANSLASLQRLATTLIVPRRRTVRRDD
jgi:hypothetical protein